MYPRINEMYVGIVKNYTGTLPSLLESSGVFYIRRMTLQCQRKFSPTPLFVLCSYEVNQGSYAVQRQSFFYLQLLPLLLFGYCNTYVLFCP